MPREAPVWCQAKDLPGLIRRRLEVDRKYVEEAARDACSYGVRTAVQLTDKAGLVDQSQYKQSWKDGPVPHGAEVRNDAPHAATLEYGRRPNRPGPPLQPIREWVYRQLVGTGTVAPEDAEHVAYMIRAKIHRDGTPPHHILAQTFEKMKTYFEAACRKRLIARG